MGLLDGLLGPALTVGAQAANAQGQGQVQGSQLLRALRMQQAQLEHLGAQTDKERADTDLARHHNRAPVLGEAGYASAMADVAGQEAQAKVPAAVSEAQQTAPIKTAQEVAAAKGKAPIEVSTHEQQHNYDVQHPVPSYSTTTILSGDGTPQVGTVNKRTGQVASSGQRAPIPGGARGAMAMTQLETAGGQAQDADKLMRAYEDQVLAGKAQFGVLDMVLAKHALKGSVAADAALNKSNPALAGYIRGAKAVAAAERMITPRGGSNALMSAEQMLASAGTMANPALIDQARNYRGRLVHGLLSHTMAGNQAQPAGGTDVQSTIDAMIRAGKSDAEIQAVLSGGH